MAAIITEKFRLHNASQFEESFTESSNNVYYLFIGKSTPFTSGTSGGSDASPPTPVDGPTDEFYASPQLIFKELFQEEIGLMVLCMTCIVQTIVHL